MWLSVTAPVTAIFDDKDNDVFPLWGRLVASFPPDRLKGTKKMTEIIENEDTVNVLSVSSSVLIIIEMLLLNLIVID